MALLRLVCCFNLFDFVFWICVGFAVLVDLVGFLNFSGLIGCFVLV